MSNPEGEKVLRKLLSNINDMKSHMHDAADSCLEMLKCINELMTGVKEATQGSEVGASQCLSALASAMMKCHTAATLLEARAGNVPPVADIAKVAWSGKGVSGKGAITVTPEIRHVQREVENKAEEVQQILKKLRSSYSYGTGGKSNDLMVFSEKYRQMQFGLQLVILQMTAYARFLGCAYNRYHNEQEDAIHRAMLIPR